MTRGGPGIVSQFAHELTSNVRPPLYQRHCDVVEWLIGNFALVLEPDFNTEFQAPPIGRVSDSHVEGRFTQWP